MADLQDIVYGYMPAQILYVAARLNVADELADGSRTLTELATATSTHPPSLRRLLRGLAALNVVTETETDRFELGAAGSEMRGDTPNSIKSSVLWFCSPEMWRAWGQLEHGVRTGEAAWEHVFGTKPFDYLAQHPDRYDLFHAAMADRARVVAPAIAAGYDYSKFGTVMDVGGGNGQLLSLILTATPGLRGVLFDHPTGVEAAAANLRAAGVDDRCEVVAGDFFVEIPDGADAYLMKTVIHDWGDEEAALILRNCRKAIAEDASLLLVERVLPDRVEAGDVRRSFYHDVNVLVTTAGKERTQAEFRELLAATGFELTQVVPTAPELTAYQILVASPS
jgi:orsellinic acid C2-O-methyltransferase